MKKTKLNATYLAPNYSYEDPFASALKSKRRICEKVSRPTWSIPDIVCSEDFSDVFLFSDSDSIQFEEKYLGDSDPSVDNFHLYFTLEIPDVFSDDEDELEDPFIQQEHDLKPEIISTESLQIFKPEPWLNLSYGETTLRNPILEMVKNMVVDPLPFDDPLNMTPLPLLPGIPWKDDAHRIPFAPSKLKIDLKDMLYPETPSYDYLMNSITEKIGTICFTKSAIPEQPVTDSKPPSLGGGAGDHQNEVSIEGPKEITENKSRNIQSIFLELPDFAASVVEMMEDHISACLTNLKVSNITMLSGLVEQEEVTAELKPGTTRLWLCKFKEELSKARDDKNQVEYARSLEKALPILLSLHGVNKALDMFLNIDYDLAYETLADFQQTHEGVLGCDFKSFLLKVFRFLPPFRSEVHPKFMELKNIILEQINNGESEQRIWIHVQRHGCEITSRINSLLSADDIEPEKHLQMFDQESLEHPSPENVPVIVTESMLKEFPASSLSAIIHYEPPTKSFTESDWPYEGIAEKVLETKRPTHHREVATTVEKPVVEHVTATVPATEPQLSSVNLPSSPSCQKELDELVECPEPSSPCPGVPKQTSSVSPVESENPVAEELEEDCSAPVSLAGSAKGCSVEPLGQPSPASLDITEYERTDLDTVEALAMSASTVLQICDNTIPTVSVVISSRKALKQKLLYLMESKGNISVVVSGYSALHSTSTYEPDILVNHDTAIIIVSDQEGFDDIRFKILSTSLKCTDCWVILLAPSMSSSPMPPKIWHDLSELARLFKMKPRNSSDMHFRLKLRLAVNYNQVAFIINDVARGVVSVDLRGLFPLSGEAEQLLQFPHFNSISASLIAEHFSLEELLTQPVEAISHFIPTLKQRIEGFRQFQNFEMEEVKEEVLSSQDMQPNLHFGYLTSRCERGNQEQCVSFDSPNKRIKLDNDLEEPETTFSASQLRNMWNSPGSNDSN